MRGNTDRTGPDTEESPLWVRAWRWESTNTSATGRQSSTGLWGRSAGGRHRAENGPRQHMSSRATARAPERKKSKSRYEGSVTWGVWRMVTLLPCSCYHPQITSAQQLHKVQPPLPKSSFLAVHPIPIPSALPPPPVVAWFTHSPLQWQNAVGHLDFGSVASSSLPLLNLLKFPLFPFIFRDGGSCCCVSGYSDQCC